MWPQRPRDYASQRCVPGRVEAAALGSSESDVAPGVGESAAALGARESSDALGASVSTTTGPTSTEALHTFTLDSGTSRCFFRDCTTVTPLAGNVPVSLADPTGGPVVARASTVLSSVAVPSGSLSGLHLPAFSMNWVTPRYYVSTACTPVSLSLAFPGPCPPSRARLPRRAFPVSRGGSAPLLTPPSFFRPLLLCKLSTWTDLAHTPVDGEGWRCVGVLGLRRALPCSRCQSEQALLSHSLLRLPWLHHRCPAVQFYHPHERRVFSSHDVTFDESVCFYRLHPHASHPVPLAPLFLVPVPSPQ
ncbi:unnamed protein product [Closterium sp. NIES-53]